MAHVNKAVGRVRRRENSVLQGLGDDTLKRSKYLWLHNTSEPDEAAHIDRISIFTLQKRLLGGFPVLALGQLDRDQ